MFLESKSVYRALTWWEERRGEEPEGPWTRDSLIISRFVSHKSLASCPTSTALRLIPCRFTLTLFILSTSVHSAALFLSLFPLPLFSLDSRPLWFLLHHLFFFISVDARNTGIKSAAVTWLLDEKVHMCFAVSVAWIRCSYPRLSSSFYISEPATRVRN